MFQTPSTNAAGSLTATEVTKIQAAVDNALGSICLGKLVGANMNITTDNIIPINSTNYIVRRITVTNASASLTLAAGGVYNATSKGGNAIVAAAQVYSALTATTKTVDLTLAAIAGTDRQDRKTSCRERVCQYV